MQQRSEKPPPTHVDLTPFALRVAKPWGWEIVWAQSDRYTGKLLHVVAGCRLSLQYHDEKVETQCLLSGSALLTVEGRDGTLHEISMLPGKGYTIQPFQIHRLTAVEDAEIVEVSTPESGRTVRLQDDYARGDETETVRALPDRGWGRGIEADG
jgi:mannose-6-phosphate isomerase